MNRLSSPVVKLAVFGVVLVATFGGGALLGAAVGSDPAPPPSTTAHDSTGHP